MGFLDKAKDLAKQAGGKLEEAQSKFNDAQKERAERRAETSEAQEQQPANEQDNTVAGD